MHCLFVVFFLGNESECCKTVRLNLPWSRVQSILLEPTVKSQELNDPRSPVAPWLKTNTMQARRKVCQ